VGLGRGAGETGARQQLDDLLHVPHVVDADLLRLPPVDGPPTARCRCSAQRGADDQELDGLQLPGAARRLVLPREDGTVTKNRVATVRSACAVLVSSQEPVALGWNYYMQQTVSAEGYSGQAFSTFVARIRYARKETRQRAPTATCRPTVNNKRVDGNGSCRARTS